MEPLCKGLGKVAKGLQRRLWKFGLKKIPSTLGVEGISIFFSDINMIVS
jgi:hypothetical protein